MALDNSPEHNLEVRQRFIRSNDRLILCSERHPENPEGSPVLFLEGIPALLKHKKVLLDWWTLAGCKRRVFSMEHRDGRHPERDRLATIMSMLKYVQNRQTKDGQAEAVHVIGHSVGAAEAMMLILLLMEDNGNDIEAVQKIIKSLTLLNSAGLTHNSWGIHMRNFFRTLLATFSLPEPERTLQKEWVMECIDPRNIIPRLRDIGYIMAITRKGIDRDIAKMIDEGFPVLALQALGDTLIPPALLRDSMKPRVNIKADIGNHLGILTNPVDVGEQVIQFLDRIDQPELSRTVNNTLYPTG